MYYSHPPHLECLLLVIIGSEQFPTNLLTLPAALQLLDLYNVTGSGYGLLAPPSVRNKSNIGRSTSAQDLPQHFVHKQSSARTQPKRYGSGNHLAVGSYGSLRKWTACRISLLSTLIRSMLV